MQLLRNEANGGLLDPASSSHQRWRRDVRFGCYSL